MIYTMMSCVEAKYLLLSGEIKKKKQQKTNRTSAELCQETCCTCLYILADKDQMRQAMKWLIKSESYLRDPKADLVNLRKLLTRN